MNCNRHIAICFLALLALFSRGCEQEGPPGIGGPWVKGTLDGTIGVYDELGRTLDDRDGFIVKVQSTGLYSSTDSEGYFRIDSLPTGTYNIICRKNGFVDDLVIGYQFIGGGIQTLNSIDMVPPSTTQVIDIQLETGGTDWFWVYGEISPFPVEQEVRSIRLFFSDAENVRYDNYLYTTRILINQRMYGDENFFTVEIPYYFISEDFFYDNIHTYYVKAYGISLNDWGYPDLQSGLMIYPSMNIDEGSGVVVLVTD